MSKTGKWILGTIAALATLFILFALCLPFFIDPNTYKELIARKVQEQSGRQLSIPGDINLKVSPLSLKTMFRLGEVRLSSTPEFPDTELLTSRLAEIQLALWPLIRDKELRVQSLRLEGVTLNLVRDKNGTTNWGGPPASAEKKTGTGQQPGEKTGSPLAAIDIAGVNIKDLNLSYVDRQAGSSVKVNNLNLSVGRIRPNTPVPVQGDFSLARSDNGKQPLTVRINARTTLTFAPDRQQVSIRDFSGTMGIFSGALPLPELDLTLTTDLDLDLRQEKVEVKKLTLQKGDLRAEAALSITGFTAPRATGTLRIPAFSPRAQAAAWGLSLPLTDPQSLTNLGADLDFQYEPQALTVSRLQLSLDQTSVTGTAAVSNLNARPLYDLTLRINQLDLNRYATSRPATTTATPPGGSTETPPRNGNDEKPLLPVALLRGLDFNADLAIEALKTDKLSLKDVQIKGSGRQGLINFSPLAAGLYDGTINLQSEIDARRDIPRIHLNQSSKGIQLGALFRDLSGKEEMTGRADVNANLTATGLTEKELIRNSNGTMNLVVHDGEIARLRILDTISAARAVLDATSGTKQTPTGTATGAQGTGRPTAFSRLTGSGILRSGVLKNDDLRAESDLMLVTGKGTVDLVREQIDYLLTVSLTQGVAGSSQTGLGDLANTPIPYRVRGTFDRIEQSAALEEIVKAGAQKMLLKELEKRLGGEKKTDSAPKEATGAEELLNKGLKSLFGR